MIIYQTLANMESYWGKLIFYLPIDFLRSIETSFVRIKKYFVQKYQFKDKFYFVYSFLLNLKLNIKFQNHFSKKGIVNLIINTGLNLIEDFFYQ